MSNFEQSTIFYACYDDYSLCEVLMGLYGLPTAESIRLLPQRPFFLSFGLSETTAKRHSAITAVARYARGAVLHYEGHLSLGVFVVRVGRVRLSTSSSDGKTMILKFAGPGEPLGLPETIAGKPYEARAEVTETSEVYFIKQANFLRFLDQNGDAAVQISRELSAVCHSLMGNVRELALTHSARKRLARFLLRWCAANSSHDSYPSAKLTLTHEEIGQAIGSSRETVTRLLSDFKKNGLIRFRDSSLLIINGPELTIHAA
jgi:CRP/FNR family cyclic AMP-dependent transcriptional regulator